MSSTQPPLVGSIVERKSQATPVLPTARAPGALKTGFPTAQHRSKSAFSRAREEQKNGAGRAQEVPAVQSSGKVKLPQPSSRADEKPTPSPSPDDWRTQIEEENMRRVAAMSPEELEEERRDVLQKFGPGVANILKRARENREKRQRGGAVAVENLSGGEIPRSEIETPIVEASRSRAPSPAPVDPAKLHRPSSPPSAMSRPGSRPSSRAGRMLRFAQVTPEDVYVYESTPASPKKEPLALAAPSYEDGPVVHLGQWKSRTAGTSAATVDPVKQVTQAQEQPTMATMEEGTPEDIRRRFFPDAPSNEPSLEWIEYASPPTKSAPVLRFDLSGTPISPALSATLPAHLGLHHHAESEHAGYTLDDIFLLSRSTVPGQRVVMLKILARIARRLGKARRGDDAQKIDQLVGQEADLRKRILAAGVEAIGERGSLGAMAVEVVWECIVGWDEHLVNIEGVELKQPDKSASPARGDKAVLVDDPVSSLPLDFVLTQIAASFGTADLPPQSLSQLLAITHRLAQHSNDIAYSLTSTPGLITNLTKTFLLTPIPPVEGEPLPDPAALQLLITLVLASRENATAVVGPADALLRFITTLPPASPFPLPLATALLAGTLRLYTALANYGMYSHIATTAQEHLTRLSRYVLSQACTSRYLRESWLGLLEAWMVCARDPHQTNPSHDILWSQVIGWGWSADMLEMRPHITDADADENLWSALWRAGAAWLEGARVNGLRGGEEERAAVVYSVKESFEDGVEARVLEGVGSRLNRALRALMSNCWEGRLEQDTLRAAALHANTLAAAIRFWLACLPPATSEGTASPPFPLPVSQLSLLCSSLTGHPVWNTVSSGRAHHYDLVFCRHLSSLLVAYLQLSRRLPGTSDSLWLAQAFAIICRLLPGDEEFAERLVGQMTDIITPGFMDSHGWPVPPAIWEKKGLEPIKPFLTFTFRSSEELSIAPLWPSPQSISQSTTQRLPLQLTARRDTHLPVPKDWIFAPLDHLLHSGTSGVFKMLPSSWNYSETEVARATLLFARITRQILRMHKLTDIDLSREETVFAAMKVFMLEHEQQQNDSTEEVFRDALIEQFLEDLLAPFSAGADSASLLLPPPAQDPSESLEAVAVRFLGPSTPFYQFYTDLVALYDAISFSHPLFARLLLRPASMRFAPDFRKYLWADYGHVLRTIHTLPEAVITDSLGEYLWPAENDPHIIAAYLRRLVQSPLQGVVRWIAVHHIACNIWPDLRGPVVPEEKAGKLLLAVADQGGFDVVKEIVFYWQEREGTLLLPPTCFQQQGGWKGERLSFIERVGGKTLGDRLGGLLQ